MRKIMVMVCINILFTACSDPQVIDVSFYGTRGNEYNLIYDISGTGNLSSGKDEIVHLKEASKEINPGTSISRRGDFYVTTDSMDKMAVFANTVYTTVDLPGGSITLNTFTHVGDDQVLLGSDFDSRVWAVKGKDAPVLIAEIAYRKIKTLEGEEHSLLMHKGKMTGEKWIGDMGGKIYEEKGEDQLNQIGYVEWRLIKMRNDNYMTIMMAKGMEGNAKWRGRHNGFVYVDK